MLAEMLIVKETQPRYRLTLSRFANFVCVCVKTTLVDIRISLINAFDNQFVFLLFDGFAAETGNGSLARCSVTSSFSFMKPQHHLFPVFNNSTWLLLDVYIILRRSLCILHSTRASRLKGKNKIKNKNNSSYISSHNQQRGRKKKRHRAEEPHLTEQLWETKATPPPVYWY